MMLSTGHLTNRDLVRRFVLYNLNRDEDSSEIPYWGQTATLRYRYDTLWSYDEPIARFVRRGEKYMFLYRGLRISHTTITHVSLFLNEVYKHTERVLRVKFLEDDKLEENISEVLEEIQELYLRRTNLVNKMRNARWATHLMNRLQMYCDLYGVEPPKTEDMHPLAAAMMGFCGRVVEMASTAKASPNVLDEERYVKRFEEEIARIPEDDTNLRREAEYLLKRRIIIFIRYERSSIYNSTYRGEVKLFKLAETGYVTDSTYYRWLSRLTKRYGAGEAVRLAERLISIFGTFVMPLGREDVEVTPRVHHSSMGRKSRILLDYTCPCCGRPVTAKLEALHIYSMELKAYCDFGQTKRLKVSGVTKDELEEMRIEVALHNVGG